MKKLSKIRVFLVFINHINIALKMFFSFCKNYLNSNYIETNKEETDNISKKSSQVSLNLINNQQISKETNNNLLKEIYKQYISEEDDIYLDQSNENQTQDKFQLIKTLTETIEKIGNQDYVEEQWLYKYKLEKELEKHYIPDLKIAELLAMIICFIPKESKYGINTEYYSYEELKEETWFIILIDFIIKFILIYLVNNLTNKDILIPIIFLSPILFLIFFIKIIKPRNKHMLFLGFILTIKNIIFSGYLATKKIIVIPLRNPVDLTDPRNRQTINKIFININNNEFYVYSLVRLIICYILLVISFICTLIILLNYNNQFILSIFLCIIGILSIFFYKINQYLIINKAKTNLEPIDWFYFGAFILIPSFFYFYILNITSIFVTFLILSSIFTIISFVYTLMIYGLPHFPIPGQQGFPIIKPPMLLAG